MTRSGFSFAGPDPRSYPRRLLAGNVWPFIGGSTAGASGTCRGKAFTLRSVTLEHAATALATPPRSLLLADSVSRGARHADEDLPSGSNDHPRSRRDPINADDEFCRSGWFTESASGRCHHSVLCGDGRCGFGITH